MRKLSEMLADFVGLFRAHEEINILGGLASAEKRAAQFVAEGSARLAQRLQHVERGGERLVNADTIPHLINECEPFEDFLLCFRAEALQFGNAVILARSLQAIQRGDLKEFIEGND